MGVMLEDIQNKACPVGFGGTFTDNGQTVEMWYVDLDPYDTGSMQAFKDLVLPPYGSTRRNVFPALVFVRDENHKLKLFAMSKEMGTILNYWFQIQIQ
jgi:hypothetical protein